MSCLVIGCDLEAVERGLCAEHFNNEAATETPAQALLNQIATQLERARGDIRELRQERDMWRSLALTLAGWRRRPPLGRTATREDRY